MTSAARQTKAPPLLWPWIVAAWLAVALFQAWSGTQDLALRLGDSDDAMRLVEMRSLLSGHGWYDMQIARLQPAEGYVSHWSRLIDAGLAGLYAAARPFTDADGAEQVMRLMWPLLWLLPAMAAAAAIALKLGGRWAAMVAIAFAAVALPAQVQFAPGRIDHHNAQIALAVLGLAAAVWQERSWAPVAAAILSALMLAVGLESLPFAALVAGAFVLPGLAGGEAWHRAGRFGGWFAVSALAGLAVTLPPARWFSSLCDQLAGNTAGAVALAGSILWLAARSGIGDQGAGRRFAAMGLAAGAALAVFAAADPVCLSGPFGHVDPAIRPIWLDQVGEAQTLFAALNGNAAAAVSALVFPLAALALGILMLRGSSRADRLPLLVMLAAVALGIALMLAMIRTFSYAAWFALPLAAAGVTMLWARWSLHRPWQMAVPAVLCSPLVLTLAAVMAVKAMVPGSAGGPQGSRNDACLATASYGALAHLEPGLVAAPTNIGAHLLALTPHEVLAAPYHRLSTGIVTAHAVLASPPDEAQRIARAAGIKWIVACAKYPPRALSDDALRASLFTALTGGDVPDWLGLVPATVAGPLRAYRVAD